MAKNSDDPVKHVVSCRINAIEKETLEELAQEYGTTISVLLRESLNLLVEDSGRVGRLLCKHRPLKWSDNPLN